MIEEHLQYLRECGDFSQATAASAQAWLRRLETFCGDRCPSELHAADLVAWHRELTWTPGPGGKLYSESSVNQAVGAVRRFYRWALAEGRVKVDPTGDLVTRVAKRTRGNRLELSPSQARKLLSSPSAETPVGIRDRAIFGILLETGASRQACANIDLGHLQLDTGALLTRGRSQRVHSLSDGLLADIERYLREARPLLLRRPGPALFLSSSGDRIKAGSIQQTLRHHRKLQGL